MLITDVYVTPLMEDRLWNVFYSRFTHVANVEHYRDLTVVNGKFPIDFSVTKI